MSDQTAIDVRDLVKAYPGGVRAVDGVTFSVRRGEIFGYLGRNGAGKTTTVRVLATLTTKTSGTAHVGGVEVAADPAAVRASVGLAMQSASLDDLMTAREHLVLACRLSAFDRARARRRADDLLETFGLGGAAERLVATYSGGMRRRLDIALSLIHRPPILFLDEPTTGLDPQSRRALWGIIGDLRDDGATVLLTTQYLEEADELADRIAVVDAGRVVAQGTPEELKASLGRTVVSFRLRDQDDEIPVRRMAGDAVAAIEGPRVRLEFAADTDRLTSLFIRLHDEGVRFDELRVSEPSLEDVFVRLTGEQVDVSTSSDAAVGVSVMQRFRAGVGGR